MFVLVCHFNEESGKECVNDGADEDDGGYYVKSTLLECAVFESGHEVHFSVFRFFFFV